MPADVQRHEIAPNSLLRRPRRKLVLAGVAAHGAPTAARARPAVPAHAATFASASSSGRAGRAGSAGHDRHHADAVQRRVAGGREDGEHAAASDPEVGYDGLVVVGLGLHFHLAAAAERQSVEAVHQQQPEQGELRGVVLQRERGQGRLHLRPLRQHRRQQSRVQTGEGCKSSVWRKLILFHCHFSCVNIALSSADFVVENPERAPASEPSIVLSWLQN